MSILERLFIPKNRTISADTEYTITNLVMDLLQTHGLDAGQFEREVLQPAIVLYRKDQYINSYFEESPKVAWHYYTDAISILYLATQTSDPATIDRILRLLLGNSNGTTHIYRVREIAMKNVNWQWEKDAPDVFFILDAGSKLLHIHHALALRIDANISRIDNVISILTNSRFREASRYFEKYFSYLNALSFPEKPYVLCRLLSKKDFDYRTNTVISTGQFRELIEDALKASITTYNTTQALPLHFPTLLAYASFLDYEYTDIWQQTDYKKKKFLKVKDFACCQEFVAFSNGNEQEVIQNLDYLIGNHYVGSSEERLYSEMLEQIIGNRKFSTSWMALLFGQKHATSEEYLTIHTYLPLFSNVSSDLNYADPLIVPFEKKVLAKPLQFNEGIALLRGIALRSTPREQRDLQLHRLSEYMGMIYIHTYNAAVTLITDDSDKKYPVIRNLVDDLNVILPAALKGVPKRQFYHYEEDSSTHFILNFKNNDLPISADFIRDINTLLFNEHTGYQLVVIPVLNLNIKKERDHSPDQYIASLSYVSQKEWEVLKERIHSEFPEIKQFPIKEVQFDVAYSVPFYTLKERKLAIKQTQPSGNAFLEDINWAWFKDKYIDQLRSHDQWYEVMNLMIQCSSGKKPATKWLSEVQQRLETMGTANYYRELQVLLSDSFKEEFWFFDTYRTALKGLIWSCTHLSPTDESLNIVRMIAEIAYTKVPNIGPKSSALGNIALDALVESGKEEAFGMLTVMRNKTKYNRFVTVLEKYVEKFKTHSEVPEEVLADKSIPRFGMENGEKFIPAGNYQVRFYFDEAVLRKTWITPEGKAIKSAPTDLDDEKLVKEINADFKQVGQVYTDLKKRLRSYWMHDRKWIGANWKQYVFEHPLIYPHIENQLWTNVTQKTDFIIKGGQLLTVQGLTHVVSDTDEVIFWHPVKAEEKKIQQWQEYVWEHMLVQKERQVFREHYPLTEKEQTLEATPRFAHHFLEVKKLMAIANSAGWIFSYAHEGVNWPRVYIKALNITAHLRCDYDRNDFAIPTKEFYFTKGDTTRINDIRTKEVRLPLSDIPAVTLSELCRDVDLFIAITSVSNNPELSAQRQELGDYRLDYEKGLFSDNASSRVRRSIIEKIAPLIKIRSSSFEGNFWIVEGKLNHYRLNLGSGFAQVKESQKHLPLLPDIKKLKGNKKLHLPIEDDEVLYILLAKGLYLQDDDLITDEKIKALL